MNKSLQLALCDTQGQLFERSAKHGYNSGDFIKPNMLSDAAKAMDMEFNHVQWAGKEYVLSALEEECEGKLPKSDLCCNCWIKSAWYDS